ncbi:embryo-specific protein ATS3B-like [Tasmannia lanceolata]|uniref:embryo-specific protein ATS3B-like n=1 Tax=Tasmannia lanceolata TaxID=3420 RepID=UPI004062B2A8
MVGNLLSTLFTLALFLFTAADSTNPHPQELRSFKIQDAQSASECSYTVRIKTSCSSISITRDAISLAFGDAYNNEVYAPRLDDPSSGTFERCSTDTFQIYGPCTYSICYLYLYRQGSDGWKPESVKISKPSSKAITFNYGTFIPYGVWYGFNLCNQVSSEFDHANGNGLIIDM